MAVKLGMNSAIGFGEQTDYDTPASLTRFVEMTGETLILAQTPMTSAGLRVGAFTRFWQPGTSDGQGDVDFEISSVGFGWLFKHALGTVVTSQPSVGTAPLVFLHTFTPGPIDGKALTIQVIMDGLPKTFTGMKVSKLAWSCQVGEFAKMKATFAGKDSNTSTTAATPTYPATQELLTFTGADLQIAGSSVKVSQVDCALDNALKVDRRALGSPALREPVRAGKMQFTGSFDADFTDFTLYNRFVNGTMATLTMTFTGSSILQTTYHPVLTISTNVRFDGETPKVGGPDEIRQAMQWTAFPTSGGGDASALTVTYQTTDATP